MYDNIGGKIKGLAKWVCIIGSIIMAISGIVCMGQGEDFIPVGILLLILGPVLCWISSWMLYGFGELIEKISNIERTMSGNEKSQVQAHSDSKRRESLEKMRASGLISEEEYRQAISKGEGNEKNEQSDRVVE